MADDRTSGESRWAVVPRVHDGLDGAYDRELSLTEAENALRAAQGEVPELEWVIVTHKEATRAKPAPGGPFIAADPEPQSHP